jgi:hypothetical protein
MQAPGTFDVGVRMLRAKDWSCRIGMWLSLVAPGIGLSSCEEGVGSGDPAAGCDEVRGDVNYLTSNSQLFDATQPTTNTSGTTRSFFWDYSIENMCVAAPEANNRAKYTVDVNASAPASLAMTGRVYAAAGFQPYTAALNVNGMEWTGIVGGIGLAQGSADGIRSDIISELVVSFTSTGDFASDLALAKSFIKSITMEVDYQYKKP